jgi:signal transduction histidine kinase
LTLRAKLLLAPAPLWLALLVVGAIAVVDLDELGSYSQDMLRENLTSVLAVRRMTEALEGLNRDAVLLLQGQEGDGKIRMEDRRRRFEAALLEQEQNTAELGEAEATAVLRAAWQAYQASLDRYLGRTPPEEARRLYFNELLPAFQAIKAPADHIVAINQAAMYAKGEAAKRQAEATRTAMLATAGLASLAGFLASTMLTSRLLRPLSVLGQAVARIGGGDFGARVRLTGHDEIAHLAEEVNAMAVRLAQYRQSSLGELLLAQQAAQSAIDSLPDPVLIFSPEGVPVSLNQAAEWLCRRPSANSAERAGHTNLGGERPDLAGLDPALAARLKPLLDRVVAEKHPYLPRGFEDAVRLAGAEGERYYLPRAVPVRDALGGLAGVTVLMQDVTRLRLFDQVKSDLVATVAHEFRTPLTSLRMAIYLCLEEVPGPLTPKQAELLSAARADCERVQAMVDDLLDLSRISEGGLKMRLMPVAAEELVQNAVLAHRAAAERAAVELATERPLAKDRVMADPERLGLVFSNLITNALRHTPAGGSVRCAARREDDFVRFSVSDDGPGIPPEHLERVFDKFYGLAGGQGGGPGLGLYIAREVTRAHGGEIGADSAPGQGSSFWFTLPLA